MPKRATPNGLIRLAALDAILKRKSYSGQLIYNSVIFNLDIWRNFSLVPNLELAAKLDSLVNQLAI